MTKPGEATTEHITCYMRIDEHGNNVTDVYRDGILIRTEPTPPSQIRKPRVSCLWKPGDGIDDKKQSEWKAKLSELKKGVRK
jgi:hypothetical protein